MSIDKGQLYCSPFIAHGNVTYGYISLIPTDLLSNHVTILNQVAAFLPEQEYVSILAGSLALGHSTAWLAEL